MTPQARPRHDDDAARRRIRESLDESLFVEASAGTGKTTEMVHRIVNVLRAGLTTIDRVVAVTFTHKAAGELKLRLRQGLDRARGLDPDPQSRRHLEDALARLEEASIGTIHSFCAQILRERPVEAVVDPAFEELSETAAARLYRRAFRGWLESKLDQVAPALRRALTRLAWPESWETTPPVEQLQFAGWKLVEWRDYPTAWDTIEFGRQKIIDELAGHVRDLAALAGRCPRHKDPLKQSLRPVLDFSDWIDRAEAGRPRDYDTVEALLCRLHRELRRDGRKGSGSFAEGLTREEVVGRRERVVDVLRDFRNCADADLAPRLREEMQDLIDRYETLKRRQGMLDFLDLLLLVRNLLRDNTAVRGFLQERFTHIFVDEFQDTDPLQAEILLLLATGDPRETDWMSAAPKPGKLFVVGDPKQSIYKFRRADVVLYRSLREALVAREAGLVHLTRSFRAVRSIQQCINAAFAPEMSDEASSGQAHYVPLEEVAPDPDRQPPVVVLPPPKPYGKQRISKDAINACLPETIVAFVDWLVNRSGWTVRDPQDPDQRVPVEARHVALLFRRFTNLGKDLTRDYVRGLEGRGIPHLLVGSRSFHHREEVETLRMALAAIEWPDDELSVYGTLRGSLFAIPDPVLFRFRHEHGRLHPFRPAPEALDHDTQPVAEALGVLARLHRGRNRQPVAETVNLLLEAVRAHAGFALRPAGRQALANVCRIADLARSFEVEGGISFRGFVEALATQAEKAETVEAPIVEEGSEGVRLMTVHGAKGLEFPVVIFADITANLAAAEPERYVDGRRRLCATRLLRCAPKELLEHQAEENQRERAEGVRVAYVAATRARDLLVVPAVGDEELDGWARPLHKALYPAPAQWRQSRKAPGCPEFGEASVLSRPDEYVHQKEFSVRPGLHEPQQGEHHVVWWDPAILQPAKETDFGLRREEILAEDEAGQARESVERYQSWVAARQRDLDEARRPGLDVVLASETSEVPPDFSLDVSIEILPQRAGRPAGKRFGALVHMVLRDAGLEAGESALGPLASAHGRALGATSEEIDAAREAVAGALGHPLLERARRSARCYRELPVAVPLDGGRLLEGVLDLAFLDRDAWTIVDFKTDVANPERRKRYERQLAWYALALARITGEEVRGCLLGV